MMILADGSDPLLTGLGQLGVAGVVIATFYAFIKQVLARETKRADDNAAEVARLNLSIQEKYIPSLLEGQRALAECNKVLGEVKDSLADLRAKREAPRRRGTS